MFFLDILKSSRSYKYITSPGDKNNYFSEYFYSSFHFSPSTYIFQAYCGALKLSTCWVHFEKQCWDSLSFILFHDRYSWEVILYRMSFRFYSKRYHCWRNFICSFTLYIAGWTRGTKLAEFWSMYNSVRDQHFRKCRKYHIKMVNVIPLHEKL